MPVDNPRRQSTAIPLFARDSDDRIPRWTGIFRLGVKGSWVQIPPARPTKSQVRALDYRPNRSTKARMGAAGVLHVALDRLVADVTDHGFVHDSGR
jgi:hypothetical protein